MHVDAPVSLTHRGRPQRWLSPGRVLASVALVAIFSGGLSAADAQAKPELTPEQRAQTFHQYADHGDAAAHLFYGICVEEGTGVKQDPVEGRYWLSAQQGNAGGKQRFADLSAKLNKTDVARSRELAVGWKPATK